MNRSLQLCSTSCLMALTLVLVGETASAAPGGANVKIVLENDKVQVRETSWKPGDVRPSEAVANRVVRVMKGGTLLREYPDGKTQEVRFQTGEVRWLDSSTGATTAYSIKNVGTTEVVLYTVILK